MAFRAQPFVQEPLGQAVAGLGQLTGTLVEQLERATREPKRPLYRGAGV
jgi:hypothetical protein